MQLRIIAKYWAIFSTQLFNSLAYPLDTLARSFTIVLFMLIFFNLWRATYAEAGMAGGSIAGLSLSDMLWYLLIAETVVLSKPRVAQQIAAQVKDGSIAYLLNKPYNFLLYQAAVAFGDSLLRILCNGVFGGAVVWWLVGPPPTLWGVLIVLPALGLSWMIDFCINALIGLSAFLAEEVSAFEWIYNKVLFILGGLLLPLDLLPGWLQQIAHALPFAATIYGPARLFVDPGPEAWVRLAATQLGWLLLMAALLGLAYRRGVAALAINGG